MLNEMWRIIGPWENTFEKPLPIRGLFLIDEKSEKKDICFEEFPLFWAINDIWNDSIIKKAENLEYIQKICYATAIFVYGTMIDELTGSETYYKSESETFELVNIFMEGLERRSFPSFEEVKQSFNRVYFPQRNSTLYHDDLVLIIHYLLEYSFEKQRKIELKRNFDKN